MPYRFAVDFKSMGPPVNPEDVRIGTWEGPSAPLVPAQPPPVNPEGKTAETDEKPAQPPAK